MDIVIPYKNTGEGLELRFALRSIEKYLKGFDVSENDHRGTDNIWIVGELPTWLRERTENNHFYRVSNILHDDASGRKQYNIMRKLFAASTDECVSKKFIYWNDDHFLLKPLHVNEIKPWYHGTLKDALEKSTNRYHTAVLNTLNHFGNIKNFDIHVPCVFEKEKIHQLYRLEWGSNEYIIKSSYFNDSEGEEMTDCKINAPKTKEAIEERIKDRLFFSVGPNGLRSQMIKKLNELYPDKSKYEN